MWKMTSSGDDEEVSEWICKSNDIISIRLIHNEDEFEHAQHLLDLTNGLNSTCACTFCARAPKGGDKENGVKAPHEYNIWAFKPTFSHQFFKDELITGYKNLKIDIWLHASSLRLFLKVHYSARTPTADSVVKKLSCKLKPGWTDQPSVFLQDLRKARDVPFTPPGKLMSPYTYTLDRDVPGSSSSASDDDVISTKISYEFYIGKFADLRVKDVHESLQFLLLLFIDGSNYIDSNDHIWEILFLWERKDITTSSKATPAPATKGKKRKDTKGSDSTTHVEYSIVGYTTLYTFLRYPAHHWLRISQVLILPPYQRLGHGQKLLQVVYDESFKRGVDEVNIEDPSVGFQAVRDLTDLLNCHASGFFVPAADGWLADLTDEMTKKVCSELHITPSQVRRCYEVFKLVSIDREDPDAYTSYRLMVKRTLHKQHEEELSTYGLDLVAKKERLHELYMQRETMYLMLFTKLQLKLSRMPVSAESSKGSLALGFKKIRIDLPMNWEIPPRQGF